MNRFIDEADRSQGVLLPETIDKYVAEENPVRVIEAFVAALDLGSLGFSGVEPKSTGRPGYHPVTMLKLYLYGYLNRIQSSRRLATLREENEPAGGAQGAAGGGSGWAGVADRPGCPFDGQPG